MTNKTLSARRVFARPVAILPLAAALIAGAAAHAQAIAPSVGQLTFDVPTNASSATPQTFTVTTTNSSGLVFTAAAAGGSSWLSVSPTGPIASPPSSFNVTVSVNPIGLANGAYTAQVILSMPPAIPQSVIVRLNVGTGGGGTGQLQVSPTTLSFAVNPNQPSNTSQNLTVSSSTSGAAIAFTVATSVTSPTGGSWLQASPQSAITPNAIAVTINPTGLGLGNYQGTISISTGGTVALTVPVTLSVSSDAVLVAPQESLVFNLQSGAAPPPGQVISVSTGNQLPVAIQAAGTTNSGGSWLQVAPAQFTTPGGVGVTINHAVASTLTSGTYTGSVTITGTGLANSPKSIPVTLNVSSSPLLNVTSALLSLSGQSGGSLSSSTTIPINSTGSPIPVAATTAVQTGSAWLSASLNSTNTPATLTVSANPAALTSGVYNGSVTITSTGQGNSPILIPVRFVVSGSPLLTVTPREMQFTYTGAAPPTQSFTIGTTAGSLSFSTSSSVITPNQGSWLSVSPTFGNAPNSAIVSINTAGLSNLAAGTYLGIVTIGSGIGDPQYLPVSLTIPGATGGLGAQPVSLSFSANPGTANQTQTVQISGTTGTGFTVTANTTSGGGWLTVSPVSGNAPSSLQVTASPGSLPSGIYAGTVSVLASGQTTPLNIPVTMNIGTVLASPTSLSFTGNAGGGNPAQQSLQISAPGATNFTVTVSTTTGGTWLSASPASGTTPGTVQVSTNITNLTAGTYTGNVAIGTSAATFNVPVTLIVNAAGPSPIGASPASIAFSAAPGVTPPAQLLSLTSSPSINFTTSTSTSSGGNWLTVSPFSGTTPASLQVIASTSGLTNGTYSGTVTIVPASGSSLSVPVTLTIGGSAGAVLQTNVTNLSFTGAAGGSNPGAQTVQVTASVPTGFTASTTTTSGGGWLTLTPASGTTPANVIVTANLSGLTAGTYNGTVTLSPAGGGTPTSIPVSLSVTGITPGANLQVSPTTMSFSAQPGGANPAAQTLNITSQGTNASYFVGASTNNGGPWLNISESQGNTPGSVQVSVSIGGLTAGTYTGVVNVSPAGGTSIVSIPVTLVIGAGGNTDIQTNPATLTFPVTVGSASVSQTVQVTAAPPRSFTVSASTSSGGGWLSVTPSAGSTPATLQITANPAGLPLGSYQGSVTVTGPSGSGAPAVIAVTLNVTAATGPAISGVTNGASFDVGNGVAPGQIVSIFGSNLGPATGQSLTLDAAGRVPTTLANTRVFFDGVPAAVLFARADQVNCVVPYAVRGRATTTVQLEFNGVRSASTVLNVADTAPGIFTLTQATPGRGQGAILNSNNVVNSATTPAAPGSIISIYLTGEGATTPAGVDGEVAAAGNLRRPIAPVSVRVGGILIPAADLIYAGSAPGLVLGAMQINVRLPANVPAGAVPIDVTIGQGTSQNGVTVAVR